MNREEAEALARRVKEEFVVEWAARKRLIGFALDGRVDAAVMETIDAALRPLFAGEVGKLALDTDLSDTHRAIHRVMRALNDGECPKCHTLDPRRIGLGHGPVYSHTKRQWGCDVCQFVVSDLEAQEAMNLFAGKMEKALAIFEEWRASL